MHFEHKKYEYSSEYPCDSVVWNLFGADRSDRAEAQNHDCKNECEFHVDNYCLMRSLRSLLNQNSKYWNTPPFYSSCD